jgi:predicted HTH domain antitoxin
VARATGVTPQYAEARVSMARAARETGVSIWEFMAYLRSKKIPSQYDFEEWERDLRTVEKVFLENRDR